MVADERQQLRAELEKRLRLPSAEMEPVWRELEEKGEVDEALSDVGQDRNVVLQDLADAASDTPEYRRLKNKPSSGGRPPQKRKEFFEVELSQYEREKAEALSEPVLQGSGCPR